MTFRGLEDLKLLENEFKDEMEDAVTTFHSLLDLYKSLLTNQHYSSAAFVLAFKLITIIPENCQLEDGTALDHLTLISDFIESYVRSNIDGKTDITTLTTFLTFVSAQFSNIF